MRVGFTVDECSATRSTEPMKRRESVRLSRPAASPAVDVVINPKKSVRTVEFSVLLGEVGKAFEVIAQKLRSA
jgi:RNase P protein component